VPAFIQIEASIAMGDEHKMDCPLRMNERFKYGM
jgi:hypothetical protein